jgi:hypothetical protein
MICRLVLALSDDVFLVAVIALTLLGESVQEPPVVRVEGHKLLHFLDQRTVHGFSFQDLKRSTYFSILIHLNANA